MTHPLSPQLLRYEAEGLNLSLVLEMPAGLHVLLQGLLAGWKTSETSGAPQPDLTVKQGENFSLASRFYQSGKTYQDIVSMLNEVLVGLAYAVRELVPGSAMIHAAGHNLRGETRVVFGARKSGKSVLTARLAMEGAEIWADDLLLWFPKSRYFKGLGMAPRLRRPILEDLLTKIPTDSLLVGEYTCYIRADRIRMAPAGKILKPDSLLELQPDQTFRHIPWLQVTREIDRHRIP